MISIRLRTRIADSELNAKVGKIIGPRDYNLLLTGPARVLKPNGDPLCIYLPGEVRGLADTDVYDVLHGLRHQVTDNRGHASGTQLLRTAAEKRTVRARPVPSAIIGAMDAAGRQRYCRLTAWTGKNLPHWQALHPLLRGISERLKLHVPDRYAAQAAVAAAAPADWVVPGTVFSTVTVNNTYPTGVHQDAGDLPQGFSTIAVLRRGDYTGGHLVFPRWRVGVDLADGDLILMDAHEWHGNTPIICACGNQLSRPCATCPAERISMVSYLRQRISDCGTPAEEFDKAEKAAVARSSK